MLIINALSTPWEGGVSNPKLFICNFSGVTSDGSAYDVYLNNSETTTSIASGEIYELENAPTITRNMFSGCSTLISVDLSSFDTAYVTDMTNMFNYCTNLRYITFGQNFFKTLANYDFSGASNLGLNEDGTDNGWLEYFAETAPIRTDEAVNVYLPTDLKRKTWARQWINILQSKYYMVH